LSGNATKHLAFDFHDYKKKGITPRNYRNRVKQFGWENILNKKGTTSKAKAM
jgi:arsenate reductase-like glutaredoxin family protein